MPVPAIPRQLIHDSFTPIKCDDALDLHAGDVVGSQQEL